MKGELTSWKEARSKIDGSKSKPTILIHYWTQCGHCQRKMPMWKKLSQDSSIDVFFLEQSNNDGHITSFPTYEVNTGKGATKPSTITEEDDPKKLKNQLLGSNGGRRRTRRLTRRRRKTAKRSLRNNMTFA
jgi:thiol-disulfide isomerase/thioredoxin